jgi:type I restriction enzyme S subunit
VIQGWKLKTLGEIAEVQSGGTPLKSRKEYWLGDIPWYSSGELNNTFTKASKELITPKGLQESNAKLFPKGSLLIGMYDTAALKMSILDRDAAFNQAIAGVKANENIDLKFILFAIKYKRFEILNQRRGVRQKNLSLAKIKNIALPIPPLPEQKRIVAILEKGFEGIDRAIANTEKNLANSRKLFESSLQFIFSNREKYWLRLQLSELLERKWITSHLDGNHGGDYPKKDEFVDSGVPYLSANCLKNESIDMSLAKYLTPERAGSLRKGIAQNNDVLFAHNATVGPVAVLRTNEIKIILSTSLTYYRCDPQFIIPEYLALYMRSNEFKSQYEAVMRQSTRNQVPITKQRTFYHIVPPIEEQQKIANHLDDLFVETQRLEIIYRQKIVALNELKQSILQKAFTGELTADTSKTVKEKIAA